MLSIAIVSLQTGPEKQCWGDKQGFQLHYAWTVGHSSANSTTSSNICWLWMARVTSAKLLHWQQQQRWEKTEQEGHSNNNNKLISNLSNFTQRVHGERLLSVWEAQCVMVGSVSRQRRSVLKAVYSAWEHSAWHPFWQLPGNSITASLFLSLPLWLCLSISLSKGN